MKKNSHITTIRELLTTAEKKASATGKEESAIKLLMQHATGKKSYDLVANLDKNLSGKHLKIFNENVIKYLDENIPVQHLIGYETFFGYDFKVNDEVLIPRFETEELVAKVLELYDEHFKDDEVDVVDIGTGCGAIGITLKLEVPLMNVTLTDISESALAVAKENAQKLGADVRFLQGDMLVDMVAKKEKFDILVSNPPYIPATEVVDSLVFDNEPHLALFGGDDGLHFYREILRDAGKILRRPSVIAFEHGDHHRGGMAELVGEFFPTSEFETIKDMQGKDRLTVILNKKS